MNKRGNVPEPDYAQYSPMTGLKGSTRTTFLGAVLVVLLGVATAYYVLVTLFTEEKKKVSAAAKAEVTNIVGQRTNDLLSLAALSFAAAVRDPLLAGEPQRLRDVVTVLGGEKNVAAVAVVDSQGRIVAAHDAALVGTEAVRRFPDLLPATGIFVRGGIHGGTGVAAPVMVFAKQIGTVILVYGR